MTTNAQRRRGKYRFSTGYRWLPGYTAPSAKNADRRPKYSLLRRWANDRSQLAARVALTRAQEGR